MKHPCLCLAILLFLPGTLFAEPDEAEDTTTSPQSIRPVATPPTSPSPTTPSPPPTTPSPLPTPVRAVKHNSPVSSDSMSRKPDAALQSTARSFYSAILDKNIERLILFCNTPFFLENKTVNSVNELKRRWNNILQEKIVTRTKLYGIDLYTFEEMVQKYGKPPEKLNNWPLKGGAISVGNIDGHAVIVLWKKNGGNWRALAIHD